MLVGGVGGVAPEVDLEEVEFDDYIVYLISSFSMLRAINWNQE